MGISSHNSFREASCDQSHAKADARRVSQKNKTETCEKERCGKIVETMACILMIVFGALFA